MAEHLTQSQENIKDLILTIRGKQVLLDSDVARLYGYEVKRVNETAHRNIKRFPEHFRFRLTQDEVDEVIRSQIATSNSRSDMISLRSQFATLKLGRGEHRKYLPFAFTEQGIGMLSGLLRSDTAVQVSIGIMDAFVEMRQFINANRDVFANIITINNRLTGIDNKIHVYDRKFDEVFDLLQKPETPNQSIFYKGQLYDAFTFIIKIIEKAKSQLVIIDNYADNAVLDMLSNKKERVATTVVTSNPDKLGKQHLNRFSQQYGSVLIIESRDFHDRFIIVDNKEVYAIGASLKDVGKKCFEVSQSKDTSRFIEYVDRVISDA